MKRMVRLAMKKNRSQPRQQSDEEWEKLIDAQSGDEG